MALHTTTGPRISEAVCGHTQALPGLILESCHSAMLNLKEITVTFSLDNHNKELDQVGPPYRGTFDEDGYFEGGRFLSDGSYEYACIDCNEVFDEEAEMRTEDYSFDEREGADY